MLRYSYVMAWGFGWGVAKAFKLLACSSDATLRLRHGLGFRWSGVGQKHSSYLHAQVMLCYGYVIALGLGGVGQ